MGRTWQFWQTCVGFGFVMLLAPFVNNTARGSLIELFGYAELGLSADVFYAAGFLLAFPLALFLLGESSGGFRLQNITLIAIGHVAFLVCLAAGLLSPFSPGADFVRPALIFVAGMGASAAWMVWGELVASRYSRREIHGILIGSFLVAALSRGLMSYSANAAPAFSVVCALVVSFGSVFCWFVVSREGPSFPGGACPRPAIRGIPRSIASVMFACGALMAGILCIVKADGGASREGSDLAFITLAIAFVVIHAFWGRAGRNPIAFNVRSVLLVTASSIALYLATDGLLPVAARSFVVQLALYYVFTLFCMLITLSAALEKRRFTELWIGYSPYVGAGYLAMVAVAKAGSAVPAGEVLVTALACMLMISVLLEAQPAAGNDVLQYASGVFLEDETAEERQARLEGQLAERFGLSPRERELLHLLSKGLTYRLIAKEMGVSESTLNGYVKSLYGKCDVHSRGELMNMLFD